MSAKQTAESFWAKVKIGSESECWEWGGCKNAKGYGAVKWGIKLAYAHRVAAYLHNIVPTIAAPVDRTVSGFVLHSCDNRACCNPRHLRSGTMKDNASDMAERGRRDDRKGEKHPCAKLTWPQVKEIRRGYTAGEASLRELGLKFSVDKTAVYLIVRDKTWKDPTKAMVN